MRQEILDSLRESADEERVRETAAETDACPREEIAAPEARGDGMPDTDDRRIRAHLEKLCAEASAVPGLDLRRALRDPAFVRLTAPEVGVSAADAWYTLHREEQERRQRELLARAVSESARRPREGGGQAAVLLASDYRSLSRGERQRVKQQILEAAARGEKIYP